MTCGLTWYDDDSYAPQPLSVSATNHSSPLSPHSLPSRLSFDRLAISTTNSHFFIMAHHYQLPSPSSSDENASLSSVGLSRQRSESAEFPSAKRTRPSQHQSVDEWAASLGQAELSGLTVDSPTQFVARAGSSLPTPECTPPHGAALAANGEGSTQECSSAAKSEMMAKVLARAATLNAQGAFEPAQADDSKARQARSAEEGGKDRLVAGLVGE